MTKEKLDRCNLLYSLIKDQLVALSDINNCDNGVVGSALITLAYRDEKFKNAFESAADESKKRLIKEFNEL